MHNELGTVHRVQAQWDSAQNEFMLALDRYQAAGDLRGQARALSNLGLVLRKRRAS
jgi:Tetratricopeptide repeat